MQQSFTRIRWPNRKGRIWVSYHNWCI